MNVGHVCCCWCIISTKYDCCDLPEQLSRFLVQLVVVEVEEELLHEPPDAEAVRVAGEHEAHLRVQAQVLEGRREALLQPEMAGGDTS